LETIPTHSGKAKAVFLISTFTYTRGARMAKDLADTMGGVKKAWAALTVLAKLE
jgi:hypothetical protein